MDENDPLFMRYCHALYALHLSLGEAAAGRKTETPSYASTVAERREVRAALARLADATIAVGMTAAQFVDCVRTVADEILAPRGHVELLLESPAIASFLFDAGLEYSAAIAFARHDHQASGRSS